MSNQTAEQKATAIYDRMLNGTMYREKAIGIIAEGLEAYHQSQSTVTALKSEALEGSVKSESKFDVKKYDDRLLNWKV